MSKRGIYVLVVLLCVALVFAYTSESAQIKVTLQSQSPDPVEPGQIVKLKFKVENEGDETKNEAVVEIFPKFPFTIYGDETKKKIGKLPAGSTGADAIIVEFTLKVDEQAVEGDSEIELKVLMGDVGVSYSDDDFLVEIQTHDAVLDITSITAEPSQIAPGGTSKVSIMVKNLADSLLKDIRFKLDFADDDLPLAPHQSSSERLLAQLESGYQNSLTFNIVADPEAASGLYKIPMNITYNDELGNTYIIGDILAVTIGDTPRVRPFIKKSSVLQADKEGKITLGIANAGTTDVKFVELFIVPSEDYQLLSTTDYFYLGDIDSDDTESEEIDIFIKKKLDKLHFPVKLKYTDANNREFQQQFDLEMNLYSKSQLKKFGIIEKSKVWIYVLILLVIVGGYVYYKKYYKQGKKLGLKDFTRYFKRGRK